jgi:heme oxygenase (biliverdin-producing, ferredoxin)
MTAALALSQRLKAATRVAHGQAERGPMMQRLLAGRLPLTDYCQLLRQLQALYQALEAGLAEHAGDPRLARLCPPVLWRGAALADDLAHLGPLALQPAAAVPGEPGPWPPAAGLAPATRAYADRLQHLARHAPLLLLAHAYVRYLGDLYGGQMLGRRLRQQHGLSEADGTRFYDFGDADRVRQLIGNFRSGLDSLALSPTDEDALVAEACEAFERHEQLFAQLAGPMDGQPPAPGPGASADTATAPTSAA